MKIGLLIRASLFLFIGVVLMSEKSLSQTYHPDFWDGEGYFKISKTKNSVLIDWELGMDISRLEGFTELIPLIELGQITKIHKAFKTPSLAAIYKFHFNALERTDLLIRNLESIDYVDYAHQNPIFYLYYTPNDVHANQWYFNLISAFEAWGISTGNPNVKVAIVDDAVKISHPDLAPIIYINPNEVLDSTDTDGNGFIDDIHGWDVSDNNNNPEPPASHWMYGFSDLIFTHGTHCAGIAAAATDNNIGIASIGFGISIIPVKAMRNNSILPLALDAGPEGVDYAIAAGADIISLSWGSGQNVPAVQDVVNAATDAEIIVVAAAGNDGNTSLTYPASYDNVISVGAITHDDVIASFSQRNDKISVMAPGDQIWSTVRADDGYQYLEGTSMACPMVAGLLGLMKSFDTTATNDFIIGCLLSSCDNIDSINPSVAGLMGAGRINAHKALLCMQNTQNISLYKNIEYQLYPNPASDVVYFRLKNENEFTNFTISDITGRSIYKQTLASGLNSFTIDVSGLSKGIYVFNLFNSNNKVVSKRLVIL